MANPAGLQKALRHLLSDVLHTPPGDLADKDSTALCQLAVEGLDLAHLPTPVSVHTYLNEGRGGIVLGGRMGAEAVAIKVVPMAGLDDVHFLREADMHKQASSNLVVRSTARELRRVCSR